MESGGIAPLRRVMTRASSQILDLRRLLLRLEGQRKFQHVVPNGDAQYELLGIFASFEPHRAGDLATRLDSSWL